MRDQQPTPSFAHAIWRLLRRTVLSDYRWPYRRARLTAAIARLRGRFAEPEYDIVFVNSTFAVGWVLDGICREIEKYSGLRCGYYVMSSPPTEPLPSARAYFFSDYPVFPESLWRFPILWTRPCLVFFWHWGNVLVDERDFLYALNHASRVITMCSLFTNWLITRGIESSRIRMLIGGADPDFFRPHERGGGVVGFSTACYERKAPERVHAIIEAMPHRRFLLLGKFWESYSRYKELRDLPNLTMVESAPYSEYAAYYAQMDVFVSASYLEGGPIPLIEAMMANAVPVASRTGFAPDVIRHGENGFLFDVDSSVTEICSLIERAYAFEGDIPPTVKFASWREYSRQFVAELPPGLQARASIL